MRRKTWQTWSAALALTLLGGGVAQAQSLSGWAREAGFVDDAPAAVARTDASSNVDSPKTPDEFFGMFPSVSSSKDDETENRQAKKRYLVCFLQTKRFAYDDVTNQKGEVVVEKGSVFDEPLRPFIESSYCAAGLVLRSLGNFDEMLTVADQYLNKEQVKAVFDALAKETREGDEIFIYWSGHGGSLGRDDDGDERDVLPSASATGGQSVDVDEMVSLYETDIDAPNDVAVRKTCLSDDEVGEMFSKLKGRKVVAFFETCRSGGLAQGATPRRMSELESRARRLVAPKPNLVTTWDGLKSKVDMTDELLKVAGMAFAMYSVKTQYQAVVPERDGENEGAASESDSDKDEDDSGERSSVSGSSLSELFEAGAKGAESDAASESSMTSLIEQFEAGAKGTESGRKDLTRQTLDNLAVAFTSGFDENSRVCTRYVDAENRICYAFVNPGAFSVFLAFQRAYEAKKTLTFEDFSYVMSATIRANNELANQLSRADDRAEASQEAHFLSNWDDAVLFDPSRPFYWDEKWNEGGEKWIKLIAEIQKEEEESAQ